MFFATAGMKHLGIEAIDDSNHDLTVQQVEEAAENIVDSYVDLTIPNLKQTGPIRYIIYGFITVGNCYEVHCSSIHQFILANACCKFEPFVNHIFCVST